MEGDDQVEQLSGGNSSGDVVRIGMTVRKPWLPTSARTTEFVRILRQRGIDAPASHGRDEQGRLVLDFVPGELAIDLAPLGDDVLHEVGIVVRSIHDASEGLSVPDDWPVLLPAPGPAADLLCHHDLAPWNLVIDGDRLVFVDWDGAGPSTRSWDLAYATVAFAHLVPGGDVRAGARRLATFVDGYGADESLRVAVLDLMAPRARSMYELLSSSHAAGHEPWGSMYADGHGEHWRATTEYLTDHGDAWRGALLPRRPARPA